MPGPSGSVIYRVFLSLPETMILCQEHLNEGSERFPEVRLLGFRPLSGVVSTSRQLDHFNGVKTTC